MKCLTPDELLHFAMEPLKKENGPSALHLAQCACCRENYELVLECLADDGNTVSAADERAAEEAAAELTGSTDLWTKLYSLVDELGKKIAAPAGNIFKPASFGSLRPVQGTLLAAAAGNGAGLSSIQSSEEVKFTFESYAAPGSGSYWKMQMTMPRTLSASSLILMKVTGENGALLDGTLNFLNQRTSLSCGCARLPFRTFLENKGCKEISFAAGRSGAASPGRIKFLPEALR